MKTKLHHPTDRLLIFIILTLLGLLSAILWVFGMKIRDLEHVVNLPYSNTNTLTPDFEYLVRLGVESLYSNTVETDVSAQRVYVPEARIYLPMTTFSRTLNYDGIEGDSASPAAYDFNPQANINHYYSKFNDITCLQRVAGFTINKKSTNAAVGSSYQGSVALADGRTLYLYQNENAGHCASDNLWYDHGAKAVIDVLKQAKSY